MVLTFRWRWPFRLLLTVATVGLIIKLSGLATTRADRPVDGEQPFKIRCESRSDPRPLKIHWLTIDLRNPEYELAVAIGRDPDGRGSIEAILTPPRTLAGQQRLLVAVNTNPWKMLPSPDTGKPAGYVAGGCCDISGWASQSGQLRSPPEESHWSFWLDDQGRPHIGRPARPVAARCAVAGFGGLLQAGQVLPRPSDVRHPRTALGLDRDQQRLTLVVVDGRQKGYSEGVSLRELAEIMQQAGCWQALNMDGGGSSIVLVAQGPEKFKVINRPSDPRGSRPVPVMLGLRRKQCD